MIKRIPRRTSTYSPSRYVSPLGLDISGKVRYAEKKLVRSDTIKNKGGADRKEKQIGKNGTKTREGGEEEERGETSESGKEREIN